MSYDRDERRREKLERKLARKDAKGRIPLDIALPIEGLSGPELDAQLRKRAKRRISRRNEFYKSVIAYIPVNLLLWIIWASLSHGFYGFPWPIFVTLGWALGLAGEAFQVYQESGAAVERREERIQREIELEKIRLGLANADYEKPKHDRVMRLSDDGELIPDDNDMEPIAKVKRS
jgi:hypothetical protein